MVLCDYIVGGGHWRSRETSITHVYFNFYIQCPSPSSLVGHGIGGHDGLVFSALAACMSGGFILGHVLAGAPDLMMLVPVIAGGASMPQWDVISTGETIIQIIEMFVRIGVVPIVRGGGWDASCHSRWCRWDARCGLAGWCHIVVVSSAIVVPIVTVGGGARDGVGLYCRACCRGLYREECELLLGCCQGGSEFSNARKCRLMVGIICHLQVG